MTNQPLPIDWTEPPATDEDVTVAEHVVDGELWVAPLGTPPPTGRPRYVDGWKQVGVSAPALPYPDADTGRTSGHSGSTASRDATAAADTSGRTGTQQAEALAYLGAARDNGVTWRELASAFPTLHHGTATRVLSDLHKAGKLARLGIERRENCSVYVLPEYVDGRETAAHGRRHQTIRVSELAEILDQHRPVCPSTPYDNGGPPDPCDTCSCGDTGDYTAHLLRGIHARG